MALREMPHKLENKALVKSQRWTLPADNICYELIKAGGLQWAQMLMRTDDTGFAQK